MYDLDAWRTGSISGRNITAVNTGSRNEAAPGSGSKAGSVGSRKLANRLVSATLNGMERVFDSATFFRWRDNSKRDGMTEERESVSL